MRDTRAQQARAVRQPERERPRPDPAEQERQPDRPDLGALLSGLLGSGGQVGLLVKLVPAAIGMVNAHGGLGGLLERLDRGGLGEQTRSWVSPQAGNAPVSGEQLTEALGRDRIDRLAEQAGVSPREAADGVARLLPDAVDRLTPEGQVPDRHPSLDPDQVKARMAAMFGGAR